MSSAESKVQAADRGSVRRELDSRGTRASLLLRLRENQPEAREIAWDEFRRRYAPIIAGFARNLGCRAQDIDDVLQDVLLGFFSVSPRFVYDPSKGRFRGYLKVCTIRAVHARMGQNAKFKAVPLAQVSDDDVEIEQTWNDIWEQEHLKRALEQVRGHYAGRNTFVAFEQYVILDKDPEQVAQSLKMSVDSVYKAKERVTKALREQLAVLEEEEG
jgi:RNA polymerase sigma-70 factor (ECF subfamily)